MPLNLYVDVCLDDEDVHPEDVPCFLCKGKGLKVQKPWSLEQGHVPAILSLPLYGRLKTCAAAFNSWALRLAGHPWNHRWPHKARLRDVAPDRPVHLCPGIPHALHGSHPYLRGLQALPQESLDCKSYDIPARLACRRRLDFLPICPGRGVRFISFGPALALSWM